MESEAMTGCGVMLRRRPNRLTDPRTALDFVATTPLAFARDIAGTP
jgi:hypothetical protein